MTSGVFNRFDQIIVNRDERQRREGGTDSSPWSLLNRPLGPFPLYPRKVFMECGLQDTRVLRLDGVRRVRPPAPATH